VIIRPSGTGRDLASGPPASPRWRRTPPRPTHGSLCQVPTVICQQLDKQSLQRGAWISDPIRPTLACRVDHDMGGRASMIVCERRCGYLPHGAAGAPVSLTVQRAWLPRAAQRRCAADPYRVGERRLLRRPLPLVLGAESVPSAARPDRAVRAGASPSTCWPRQRASGTTALSAPQLDVQRSPATTERRGITDLGRPGDSGI
jgi:hypothetical protein